MSRCHCSHRLPSEKCPCFVSDVRNAMAALVLLLATRAGRRSVPTARRNTEFRIRQRLSLKIPPSPHRKQISRTLPNSTSTPIVTTTGQKPCDRWPASRSVLESSVFASCPASGRWLLFAVRMAWECGGNQVPIAEWRRDREGFLDTILIGNDSGSFVAAIPNRSGSPENGRRR